MTRAPGRRRRYAPRTRRTSRTSRTSRGGRSGGMSVQVEAPAEPPVRRAVRWRRVVAFVVAALLLAGVARVAWWWSHPEIFEDFNAETGMDKPFPIDRAAMAINVTMQDDQATRRTFTVRHLSAHLDTNTAEA